jgi:hypothetical protein
MKIIIPNIENLPPDNNLNLLIDGLNQDHRTDNVYRASVAAAIARFLAERPESDTDLDWIRKIKRLIGGVELHTPTVENTYADLVETEKVVAPDRQFPIWATYTSAIIVSFFALYYLSSLYRECKLGWLGAEMQATVVQIPEQNRRGHIKYIYVGIGSYSVPVMISSRAYAQKRFQVGQVIAVKYHEAAGSATLSGEINGVLLFAFIFLGSTAMFFWIIIYRKTRH